MANRKLTLFLILTAFVSMSVFASAQGQLTLGQSSMQWTFEGIGSSTQIGLNVCNNRGCGGTASGTGSLLSGPAPYYLVPSGMLTLTLLDAALGTWSISGPTVDFLYGSVSNTLLTGTLTFLNLQETPGTRTGTIGADMLVTGGSLASNLGTDAVLDVNLLFNSKINIQNLLGMTGKRWAHVTSGTLVAAPEPGSILLLGSGLLGMGSMLRFYGRKKKPPRNLTA